MDVTESDDSTFGFRARSFYAGRPVRLKHQPHGPRRNFINQFVKKLLRRHPQFGGLPFFEVPEFLLEPVDHPVAPVHLDFNRVVPGNGCGVGGNQRYRLDILFVGYVNRGSCSVTKAADTGIQTSGADDFAGLVGCRRYQG